MPVKLLPQKRSFRITIVRIQGSYFRCCTSRCIHGMTKCKQHPPRWRDATSQVCEQCLKLGIFQKTRYPPADNQVAGADRSEEHKSELQSLMRISYDVFCMKKKNKQT